MTFDRDSTTQESLLTNLLNVPPPISLQSMKNLGGRGGVTSHYMEMEPRF